MGVILRYVGEPNSFDEEQLAHFDELQVLAFNERYLDTAKNHWWLATDEESGKNAGFCTLYHYPDKRSTAFLSLAAVAQGFRGLSLQKRMIRTRVKKAKKLGISRVLSYTSPDNIHSSNNLFACGFKLYLPKWHWGLENGLYFQKFI